MNSVILTGYIGREPEVNMLPSGTRVATFSIAVNDVYRKGEAKNEKTHWFTVKCFGKLADRAASYLSKGNKVGIVGKLNYEEWEAEGGKRSKISIIANTLEFMSPRTVDTEEEPF